MRRGELAAASTQLDLAAAAFREDGSARGLAMVDCERSLLAFREGAALNIEACRRALGALTDRNWRDTVVRRLFSLYAVAVERADPRAPELLPLLERAVKQLGRTDLSTTLAALKAGDSAALAAACNALKAASAS
jgi:hypothetical protein